MKKNYLKQILSVLTIAITTQATAQTLPNSFNYQAVINSDDGTPISNKEITVEVSIMQGSDCDNGKPCTILWQELHKPSTNDFGIFNIEIGSDNAINTFGGTKSKYSEIEWLNTTNGYYYMRVRVDFGEASYLNGLTDLGTTKFSAVPYSLVALSTDYAERANSLVVNANGKVNLNISDLGDVDVKSPTKNQILVFDGSKWQNTDPTKAQGLTNVNITSPKDGQYLVYDNASANWVNKTFTMALGELSDVKISTLNNKEILMYDNTNQEWKNKALKFSDISDVSGTDNTTEGYVLTYSSGTWSPAAPATSDNKTTKLSELTGDVNLPTASNITEGDVLTYDKTSDKWVNKKNENIWVEGTEGYYAKNGYKVAVGEAISSVNNGAGVLFKVSNIGGTTSLLANTKGITVGNSEDRVNGKGSIALAAGGSVNGAACIGGRNATVGEFAVNCLVLGTDSDANAENCLVVGKNCKAGTIEGSSLIGSNLSPIGNYSLACGMYNVEASDQLFAVGNGNSGARSTAFYIGTDGSGTIKGTLNSSSDARLKTQVNTLSSALDNVMKMRGVSFRWDKSLPYNANSSEELQYGFIAQEIEKIFPNLVNTNANGYKTVNYLGVIPVLTEAIKDQQSEIEKLKAENEELKSVLEALLIRVSALEVK